MIKHVSLVASVLCALFALPRDVRAANYNVTVVRLDTFCRESGAEGLTAYVRLDDGTYGWISCRNNAECSESSWWRSWGYVTPASFRQVLQLMLAPSNHLYLYGTVVDPATGGQLIGQGTLVRVWR